MVAVSDSSLGKCFEIELAAWPWLSFALLAKLGILGTIKSAGKACSFWMFYLWPKARKYLLLSGPLPVERPLQQLGRPPLSPVTDTALTIFPVTTRSIQEGVSMRRA